MPDNERVAGECMCGDSDMMQEQRPAVGVVLYS